MKRFLVLSPLFLLLIGLTFSCNKKGCSDPTADNYEKNVKKAQDKRCKYNGEGVCGEGISFCVDIDGTKKKGDAVVSYPNNGNTTRVFWSSGNDSNVPGYMDVLIDFPTGSTGNLTTGTVINSKKFQAEHYSFSDGLSQAGEGSSLNIKKNDSSDGIIATFSFTLNNGKKLKNGNIYKAK